MFETESDLVRRDLQYNWHPCSQMKDYELFKPLEIARAQGCYLELKNGKKIIDAIASWWCKSLGHNHPRIKKALLQQIDQFEHVIFANTTNDTIVELSEKLAQLTHSLDKVFYASDGSCAVEIAMKMSLHSRVLEEKNHRKFFIALENSYHGETLATLSVSDVGIYRDPYRPLLFETYFVPSLPYVSDTQDPLWYDCAEHWEKTEKLLEPWSEIATAILVEPIVQGAGGMKIYSQDFLKRLRSWANDRDIHLIADEIMTGMGRTGKMLACEHAGIEPDFLCIAKGLTSGWLPMSAVLTSSKMYGLFYADYTSGKSFLHSHTHSGNVLAARVALEVLKIFSEEKICEKAEQLGICMQEAMLDIADKTKKIKNVRGIGAILAADLVCEDPKRRLGFEIYQKATALGALLRPIGNTIYWLPPLNMDMETLSQLKTITYKALM